MESNGKRPDLAVVNAETRIARTIIEEAIEAKAERVTYADVAAKLGMGPKHPRVRAALRSACRWSSLRVTGVEWLCEPDTGYRRANPTEAADMMAVTRKRSARAARRSIRRAQNLTTGATLSDAQRSQVFVELAAASAMMTVGSAAGVKKIAARIQSEELPTPEVLKLLAGS